MSLDFDPSFPTLALVRHDGKITYVTPGAFTTACKMDLTYYPFDWQRCSIKFGSWTYNGDQVSEDTKQKK
jgi:hypothetical protein